MLTESIPVKHKSNSSLGYGVILGSEVVTSNEKGKLVTKLLFLVCWENNPIVQPHSNGDLIHLIDIKQWFSDYFETDDDPEDFLELSDEEEEEEKEENETISIPEEDLTPDLLATHEEVIPGHFDNKELPTVSETIGGIQINNDDIAEFTD